MAKKICANCGRQMRIEACGIPVLELRTSDEQGGQLPYKLYSADRVQCPGECGIAIMELAMEPYALDFQDGFNDQLERARMHSGFVEFY